MCDVQEKQDVEQQVEKARGKVRDLVALEQKLSDAITKKRHGLLAAEMQDGKEYRDEDTGVRLTYSPLAPQ